MNWIKAIKNGLLSQSILPLFLLSLSNYGLSAQDLSIGTAQIATWKGNKQAALILQFDDSTPGQATLGLSACINRNIIGTWYINPGTYIYNEYRDYWENIAPAGGQELANHTMNHTGANTYDEIVYEVGQASREIWRIRGHDAFTSLIAFNRGGGTSWNEEYLTQVLEEYLNVDRLTYPGVPIQALSVVPGSNANEMFNIIPTVINEGIIGHINFHGIAAENGSLPMDWGNSAVWIDEFEAFLDLLLGVQDELWIDGYTSVYKYRREELASTIATTHPNDNTYIVNLTTLLNTNIYDELLTILLRLPPDWDSVIVQNNGSEIEHSINNGVLIFDILPNTGDISILRNNNGLIAPTSVATSEIEICSGLSTSLSFIGGSGNIFAWYTATCGGTLIGTGNNLNVSPIETTSYFGRWETGNESTVCESITITINSEPEPPSSVSASDVTICNGASTILSYSDGSGTTFAWYSGSCGGEFIGLGNNLTVAPTTTTTYYGRWENQCGYSDCQSMTINVNNLPPQPSPIIGEANVCPGTLQTYRVENSVEVNYQWGIPSGWSGNSSSNEINVYIGNAAGNISVTPSNSCGEGPAQNLTVIVPEEPVEAEAVFASNETVCAGTPTTLSYSSGSGSNFRWYSNSCGEESIGTGNNLEVVPTTTTTYYGRWENQCGYSDCQSITINVNNPPLQPSPIIGEANVCPGTLQTYRVENSVGVNYQWGIPGGWSGNSSSNEINVYIGNAAGNISVTESNSCGEGPAQNLTVIVTEEPVEAEAVFASNETICNGALSTLSYFGGSGSTFAWYSGSCGDELIGIGNNLTITPTATTSYYGRWENQCGYSACKHITISVKNVPNQLPGISGETHPCIHSELTYSVENSNSMKYEWSLPQGYTGSSNTNQIMVIIGSTKGNIKVTPLNSCGYGISKELFITPDSNLTEILEQPHDINAKIGDDVSFNLNVLGCLLISNNYLFI